MNTDSRVQNSARNLVFGLLSQAITLLLNFVVRTVFIRTLGKEYLGVNGLFSNILTVLSLAEMGFGVAMVYSMYKPLADGDKENLKKLMSLYAKVYKIIGIVVACLGLCVIPFFDYIIKDTTGIENLRLIYLLFLANSVVSYFFAYKQSILNADQKAYVISKMHYYVVTGKSIVQIIVLYVFKNFLLYLLIQILGTLAENILISLKVNKMYPYLKYKTNEKLDERILKRIKKDVYALILSNIGRVSLNGTDNIIISSFVGVAYVGMLSNYTLITSALIMVISQLSSAVRASLGNFIAKESSERYYGMFKKIDFMNFWIYSFSTICLIILVNPFIKLWVGEEYCLPVMTVIVFCVNFFVEGMLQSLWSFRTTMGLFVQGKYRPLIAAALNIIVSIVLGKYLGITGVLLGTTVSRLCVNGWYDPYIIFKYGLNHKVGEYYLTYLKRFILISIIIVVLVFIYRFICIYMSDIAAFIVIMGLSVIVPNTVYVFIFRKSEEFSYLVNIIKSKVDRK